MVGCRRFVEPHALDPGDYCLWHGVWYACTPDGRLANLSLHTVRLDGVGCITVSPSILVRGGPREGQWHGYLERGVWRSC